MDEQPSQVSISISSEQWEDLLKKVAQLQCATDRACGQLLSLEAIVCSHSRSIAELQATDTRHDSQFESLNPVRKSPLCDRLIAFGLCTVAALGIHTAFNYDLNPSAPPFYLTVQEERPSDVVSLGLMGAAVLLSYSILLDDRELLFKLLRMFTQGRTPPE